MRIDDEEKDLKNLKEGIKADLLTVSKNLSLASVLEGLAEECSELTQAALKYSRILRSENPTPVTLGEAMNNLDEEIGDVLLVLAALGHIPVNLFFDDHYNMINRDLVVKKAERWATRISLAESVKNGTIKMEERG